MPDVCADLVKLLLKLLLFLKQNLGEGVFFVLFEY